MLHNLRDYGQTRSKNPHLQRWSRKQNRVQGEIESPLCNFCNERGIWGHLSATKVFEKWILDFIMDPEDVNGPSRQNCPFCRMVFNVLPETAFAPEHREQYQLRDGTKQSYCDIRPLALVVKGDIFTSFLVVYNFREYVSHMNKVFQNYRATLGLDSNRRRHTNVPGITRMREKDTVDASLVRKWIRQCRGYHRICAQAELDPGTSIGPGTSTGPRTSAMPTLLIDVRAKCLVKTGTSQRM